VDVVAGSARDHDGSLELVQQAEANTSLDAEAVLADMAYGSGENRERFAEVGIELLAKVPRRHDTGYFDKDRFEIDTEKLSCRCPAGQVTHHLIKSGRTFQFTASVCTACPLRSKCYSPGRKGRQVALHPQEAMIQAARKWQQSPAFDDFRKQRQVVEHRIARMAHLGVRQARYFGRRKTLFQVLLAATVANLTLVLSQTGPLKSSGGPPRTRNRPLERLRTTFCRLYLVSEASILRPDFFRLARPTRVETRPLLLRMAISRPGL
jgi:hypothetical protein